MRSIGKAVAISLFIIAAMMPNNGHCLLQGAPGDGTPWPKSIFTSLVPIPVCFRSLGTIDYRRVETAQGPEDREYKVGCLTRKVDGSFIHSNCYTHDEWMEKRSIVQDALMDSWAKWTNIIFYGWGECSSDLSGCIYVDLIRTDPWDFGGDSMPRGYHPGGVKVWIFMDTEPRRFLRTIIIHEFGHALGFHHEMDRADAVFPPEITIDSPPCRRNQCDQCTNLTPYYDDVSIMNYCAPSTRNGLSGGDIEGAQKLYGTSKEGDWLNALPSLSLYAL